MRLPPHEHRCHSRTHTRRHYWFPGYTHYIIIPLNPGLIHHRLAMLVSPLPNLHSRHPRPHTR